MNNYFTMRRANRLRVKLLNSKARSKSERLFDICGVPVGMSAA